MGSDNATASTASASSVAKASASAAGASTEVEISARDQFLVDSLRNSRYHEDRERFFARIHKLAMFTVVASGTASFAWLRAAPILAGVITLAGLLDLVFDVSGKARLHASLRRRIYDIIAQLEDPTRSLENLREQAIRVYADEPPCMHAANIIAFNAAMEFLHRPREYQYQVKWYQRWLRHVWSFASTDFRTYGEIAKQGSA